MSKTLVDIGVWCYSLYEEGFEEAKRDAQEFANKPGWKTGAPPLPETRYYVMQDNGGYYGPMNEAKRVRDARSLLYCFYCYAIGSPEGAGIA